VNAQLPLFATKDRVDPWTVRTSRRARRLSVRVYPGGRVEIVAPHGASPAIVQRFIGQHRQWIDERVRDCAAQTDPPLPEYIDLPAIEARYAVSYVERDAAPRISSVSDGQLTVVGSSIDPRLVRVCLRNWLVDVAAIALTDRLRDVADEFGFDFERVQIRQQRTRWGSCSSSGTISLNVCALFVEPEVMRYLLIHELCHTRHMNHSRAFWELVGQCEPNYRKLDRTLIRAWRHVPKWMFG
jgi:predicted metal-dependent hydrolase